MDIDENTIKGLQEAVNLMYTIEFIVRIVDTRNFLAPAENIKVRSTDPASAATMAVDIYRNVTGEDIGEITSLRKEKFIYTSFTNKGYLLEVFSCQNR